MKIFNVTKSRNPKTKSVLNLKLGDTFQYVTGDDSFFIFVEFLYKNEKEEISSINSINPIPITRYNQTFDGILCLRVKPEGLVKQVEAVQPDIVLLDWQLVTAMPEGTIRNLKSVEARPQVIVLHVRSETYVDAKAAGADYFFCKDSPPDQLLACLRELKQERVIKDPLQKDD